MNRQNMFFDSIVGDPGPKMQNQFYSIWNKEEKGTLFIVIFNSKY